MATNGKIVLMEMKINGPEIKSFLADPSLRGALKQSAENVFAAIPESDVDGERQLNGKYTRKFIDEQAVANDGRVAIDVGVEGADHGFFRLMTLQRAIRATGAILRRKKR